MSGSPYVWVGSTTVGVPKRMRPAAARAVRFAAAALGWFVTTDDASEVAVGTAREAVQVHGGYGYMEDLPVARYYRDSKVLEIGEGTSEIMRWIIARDLGLPETDA